MKTAESVGLFRYTYVTTGCAIDAGNGFVFSVRADSRMEADRIALEKARTMRAVAEFVKVI